MKTFYIGMACDNGHLCRRYASNGKCVECVKLQNKSISERGGIERNKALYQKQKHRILARNKAARRARGLKPHGPPPRLTEDQKAANIKAWKDKNTDRMREYFAGHYQENRAKKIAQSAQYAKDNPEQYRLNRRVTEARRRARILESEGSHSRLDILDLMTLQKEKCAGCRRSLRKGFHVDHVKPLKLRGSNARRNLQLLCRPCNASKAAKDPVDWAKSLGLLI